MVIHQSYRFYLKSRVVASPHYKYMAALGLNNMCCNIVNTI
jgi:hypothetical protein